MMNEMISYDSLLGLRPLRVLFKNFESLRYFVFHSSTDQRNKS